MAERPATARSPASDGEKRRAQRLGTNYQMALILQNEGRRLSYKVRTVDISQLGLRIRLVGSLISGQTVDVVPAEGSWNSYPCRVVWSRAVGSEFFNDAGLEFKTPWTAAKSRSGA